MVIDLQVGHILTDCSPCPSQSPLLSINLKSHNILDQCAGAIQAQCGEPVEGGSSYRPLRRTSDEINF